MPYSLYAFVADTLIALVILLGVGFGYKRGFLRTVTKPVKLVASLLIAYHGCTALANAWLTPLIEAPIRERMSAYLHEACADMTVQSAAEQLPTMLKMAAGMFGIDITEAASAGESVIDSIVSALAHPAAHLFALVFAFVGLYFAAKLVLSLGVLLVDTLFSGGILGIANRIVGVLFSTLLALLIAWGLVALAEFVFGLDAFSNAAAVEQIRGGVLYRLLNEYSPLDLLLSF